MASNNIKQFYFYSDYDWTPEDFRLLQLWLLEEIQGLFEGLAGAAVLKGLVVRPSSGMNCTVDSGIAVSDGGQMMVNLTQFLQAVPAPVGGNPANHLLVMRPKTVDMDNIPEPLNPSNPVPLHFKLDYDFVLIQGTPAATPTYPAITPGDCIVMGFQNLATGQTQLLAANLDLSVVGRPRKRRLHVAVKTGTYNSGMEDDVVELDATSASGLNQLPPAASASGMKVTTVKTDSSANRVAVSGNGAETISGQNAIYLDDQWDAVTVYSNGISWRQI